MDVHMRACVLVCTDTMKPLAATQFRGDIPYDLYCPSLAHAGISKRICKACELYMPSVAAVTRHRKEGGCPGRLIDMNQDRQPNVDAADDELQDHEEPDDAHDSQTTVRDGSQDMPPSAVMRNIFDILNTPWESV